jgi:Skp family chaperone for outer membrane proteins
MQRSKLQNEAGITDQDIKYFYQLPDHSQQLLKDLKTKYKKVQFNIHYAQKKLKYIDSFLRKYKQYQTNLSINELEKNRNQALLDVNQSIKKKMDHSILIHKEKVLQIINYNFIYKLKEIEKQEVNQQIDQLIYDEVLLRLEIRKFRYFQFG